MKELSKFFSVDLSFLIIGALSGLIAMNSEENRKKSRWERFIIGLTGVCSAVFLTPLIVWLIQLCFESDVPHGAQLGIAFTVGQLGLEATKRIFNFIMKLKEMKDNKDD